MKESGRRFLHCYCLDSAGELGVTKKKKEEIHSSHVYLMNFKCLKSEML